MTVTKAIFAKPKPVWQNFSKKKRQLLHRISWKFDKF